MSTHHISHRTLYLSTCFAGLLCLVACGQKGPLVRPNVPPATSTPYPTQTNKSIVDVNSVMQHQSNSTEKSKPNSAPRNSPANATPIVEN